MTNFESYLVAHVSTVLAASAAFAMMSGLGGQRRTSQSTLAWLLGVVFMPFVAIPLFLLVGSRKFPTRAKRPEDDADRRAAIGEHGELTPPFARVLRSCGVAPPREGNSFELLVTGDAAYVRLMDLIAGAQRTIDLTMFILGHDATGHAVVDALAERAAKGVSVRVILDAVGLLSIEDAMRRRLWAGWGWRFVRSCRSGIRRSGDAPTCAATASWWCSTVNACSPAE